MNDTIIDLPLLYIGFASLHLFCGHFLSSWIYLRRFKKNPMSLYQAQQNTLHGRLSKIITVSSLIWGINLIVYPYSVVYRDSLIGAPIWQISPIYGWVIGVMGLIGMLYSQYGMGVAFRIGQDESSGSSQNTLKETGIFSVSRNPIYFFSVLYLLGISLWVLNPITILGFIIIAVCIHGLVLQEERYLTCQFGQVYQSYCDRVPRYIPNLLGART